MIKVKPNVTDPSMRNSKMNNSNQKDDPIEILKELGGDDDDLHEIVFKSKNKTDNLSELLIFIAPRVVN